ncbi:MAG: ATP synthase F0 subunit B [Verrucomicrobiales bacterium]
MGDIAKVFDVDMPTLISQCVILFVVFAVLNKYAFGPVTQLLLERRRRIEEAEANFAQSREKLATAASEAGKVMDAANVQAARMIKEAQEAAASTAEKKRQEAIAEAAAIIAKGREAATLERDQVFATLKRDFGRLVVETTGKVTGKVLSPEDHARINQEAVSQISR